MEDTNSCSICYEDFDGKETARPNVCDHVFCFQCIQKWGKLKGWCPIDRKRFRKIVNLSTSTQIQIKPQKRKKQRILYDVSSYCEVCTKETDNNTLIMCDSCDLGYHLSCLTPPLSVAPPGIWNCPVCVAVAEKLKSKKGITKDVDDIGRNHTNLDTLTSSESSSSDTSQKSYQPCSSKIGKNNSKPETETRSKNKEKSSNAELPPSKKRRVYRTRSAQEKKTMGVVAKLRRFRRRDVIGSKHIFQWFDSSDESMASTDYGGLTTPLQNDSENTRVKTLRPRNIRKNFYDSPVDSSDTFNGYSEFDRREKSPKKCSTNPEQSNNGTVANPESGTSTAKASTDNGRLTIQLQNDSENTRVRTSRPRNFRRVSSDSSVDSSDTFNLYSGFDGLEKSPKKCSDPEQSNVTVASPESGTLTAEEDNKADFATESSAVSCTADKTVPEAIIASPESQSCDISDITNSNICIISGSCSLKDSDNKTFITLEEPNTVTNASEKSPNPSSCHSEIQTFEDDDEISVIATVVKDHTKPRAKEEFEDIAYVPSTFFIEPSSEDDLPALDLSSLDAKDNKLEVLQETASSKLLPAVDMKPVFNVSKKLENEDLPKNYLGLNKAVKMSPPTNRDSAEIVRRTLPDTFKLCSRNIEEINKCTSLKTNAISEELRAIEKEKWKTHRLRLESNLRPAHNLKCCKRYGKNHYKSTDVVHIGKHFCQKRYSDNYKELLLISKSLRKKPKFDKNDIVVLNSLKRNVKGGSQVLPGANYYNNQSSGISNYPTSLSMVKEVEFPHHEIITFDKEGLQGLIKTQSRLVRATLCLSKLKHLDIQKDGFISLNWQK